MKPRWGWLGLLAIVGLAACDPSNTICTMLCTHTAEVRLEPPFATPGAYKIRIETDSFETACMHSLPWENRAPDCETLRGQMDDDFFQLSSSGGGADLDAIVVPNRPSSVRVFIENASGTVLDETVRPTYTGKDSSDNCTCERGSAVVATL